MAAGLRAMMTSVKRRISVSSSSAGTTRLTRPQASAVCASMVWPVSSISIVRLRPMLRTTPTAGVEQKTPMLTPGSANAAASAATARSHIDTSWQPAAVARPWTRAITGCGSVVNASIIRPQASNNARCQRWSAACARISLRSWPAQNPLPSPASTTTRAEVSAAALSSSACSAAIMSDDSGLNRSPRLSVSVSTPSRAAFRTSGVAAPDSVASM